MVYCFERLVGNTRWADPVDDNSRQTFRKSFAKKEHLIVGVMNCRNRIGKGYDLLEKNEDRHGERIPIQKRSLEDLVECCESQILIFYIDL